MKTIEMNAYEYKDLSPAAKERVRQDYMDSLHDGWYDCVFEDFTARCNAAGFRDPEFQFSLGYCQGDGASFSCWFRFEGAEALKFLSKEDSERAQVELAKDRLSGVMDSNFLLEGKIVSRGRYSHEGDMTVDSCEFLLEGPESESIDCGDNRTVTLDNILEAARDIARDLYKALREEYEFLTSEEQVAELAEINACLFDEHGRLL